MRFLVTISFIITVLYWFSTTSAQRRGRPFRRGARRTAPPARKIWTKWYKCDFEDGYCGWKNDSTAEFEWYRTDTETPTDETGPRWDHTRGNGSGGHYLYIETSVPRDNGDHARLISPVLVQGGTFCLKFWHNMHGSDVKDLNVHLKGRRSKKRKTILHLSGPWSVGKNRRNVRGEDNDWWNQESVEFTAKEPLNIIFEGIRGKLYRGDIAIDDINLTKGRCPRQSIDCTFENNMCGWTQMSGDEFNWLPNRGSTQTKDTGPTTDHTLKNQDGRYLYIETSWPRIESDKARLISPRINCDKGATPVFNLWYNMNGDQMGPLKVYATSNKLRLGKPIWQQSGNHKDIWLLGQVSIPKSIVSKGFFFIVIEAERHEYQGDAAIDDVSLAGCQKNEMNFGRLSSLTTSTSATSPKFISTTTHPWVRDPGSARVLPGGIECNFEHGSICAWRQDTDDQFNWEVRRGKTPSERTGPKFDHTTRKGWYLYAEASTPKNRKDQAVLRSPPINPKIACCISFYYHMFGKNMGKLELLSAARGSSNRFTKNWMKQGQLSKNDTDWKFAKVDVRSTVPYEIIFRATVGSGFYSDIAIDDIKVDPTPCEEDPTPETSTTTFSTTTLQTETTTPASVLKVIPCNFGDGSLCSWKQILSPTDDFDWSLATRSMSSTTKFGPMTDHTSGSRGGFLFVDGSIPKNEEGRAMLSSPVFRVKKPMCLQFWYHIYGEGAGNLTLYRKVLKNRKLIPLWSSGSDKGNLWLQGQVDIKKLGDTALVIEAKVGEFWEGDISVDDIEIIEGECKKVDCDFEESNCAWVQDPYHDEFNWTRHSGPTKSKNTGPDVDHTLKSENGTYLYIEASNPQQRYDKARLIGPVIDPGFQPAKCLSFWFHSLGEHVGSINVYKKAVTSNETYFGSALWTNARNEGNQWLYATVNVLDELPYQIVIEGTRGLDYLGDLAIDDIKLTDGPCDHCCDVGKFKCGNNFCISRSKHCNKVDDCGDGSDESFCDDGPPCGTPHIYAPVRERMDISTNVLHDEGISDLLIHPLEGEPLPTKNKIVGAQQILDWQWSRLKHGISRVAVDPGLYSEDIHFSLNGGRRPETFSVERKKRNSGVVDEFLDDVNSTAQVEINSQPKETKSPKERTHSVELIHIQDIEKRIDEGDVAGISNDDLTLAKIHKIRRKKTQDSLGRRHQLSKSEWKIIRQKEKLNRAERVKRTLQVKKIIGGDQTSQYNYPWQVAYYVTDSGSKTHYFCGATLIDRYWIVTAAHCPHLGDVHNVVIGDYDLYTDEGTEQEIVVHAIYVHDVYKFDEDLEGDIALIQLRYPAKQSKAVQLACLLGDRDEPFEDGEICVTTGWGRTVASDPGIERYLRQAEMPIVSNSRCKSTFWPEYKFHDSYICAGGIGGNSCRGDSGGPLLCKKNEQFYLVGITSWGDTKCKSKIPGVYTRVQSYNNWMKDIMMQQKCKTH